MKLRQCSKSKAGRCFVTLAVIGLALCSILKSLRLSTTNDYELAFDVEVASVGSTLDSGSVEGRQRASSKNYDHQESILQQFEEQTKFLVVCYKVDPSLIPIFDNNFTIIRLMKKRRANKPPPWNATVFLHGEYCADHPYVVESMIRRDRSPYLVAATNNHSSTNNDNDGSSWAHGVRWPNYSMNATNYLRAIQDRPAIIRLYGEVNWRMQYAKQSCSDVDFVVYRESETIIPDCLTIHSLQGVWTTMSRGKDGEFGARNTADIFAKKVDHPNKPDGVVNYDKFCSFIVRYNSTHLVHMFNHTKYDIDALVRHMFFLQLSEYKQCERIVDCSFGGPYTAFQCMVGYKFHITMENTLVDGYVSEKLFK